MHYSIWVQRPDAYGWQDKASLRSRLALLGKFLSAHCFRLRKRRPSGILRCVSDAGRAAIALVMLANPQCHRDVRTAYF